MKVFLLYLFTFFSTGYLNLFKNYESLSQKRDSIEKLFDEAHLLLNSDENYQKKFTIFTKIRKFNLCLNEITNVFSNKLKSEKKYNKIKIYEGIICENPSTLVFGTIINNIFHGTINENDGNEYYFEDPQKFKPKFFNCADCDTILYSYKEINHNHYSFKNISCGTKNHNKHYYNFQKKLGDTKNEKINIPKNKMNENKICSLTISLHPSYVQVYGSVDSAISEVARHISTLNNELKQNINEMNDKSILFQISSINILASDSPYTSFLNEPDRLLYLAAAPSQAPSTCSHGLFFNQDWNGILGVAFVGNSLGVGICNNHAAFVVTIKSFGSTMTSSVHRITTIHEIGHTLGSIHDPADGCDSSNCFSVDRKPECSPANNEFIMSVHASSGIKSNNLHFSPCSKEVIKRIIDAPGRRTCLLSEIPGVCGNGIIEEGEECDPGFRSDKCCGGPDTGDACKIILGSCSPSQGNCCDGDCQFVAVNTVCSVETDCKNSSLCLGVEAKCPESQNKPDNMLCLNSIGSCQNGVCSGSPCSLLDQNLEECKCIGNNSCSVCCQNSSNNDTCQPFSYPTGDTTRFRPSGSDCMDNNSPGLCNQIGRCVVVLNVSPIEEIIRKLLSGEIFNEIFFFFQDFVEYFMIGFTAFMIFFSTFTKLLNFDTKKELNEYSITPHKDSNKGCEKNLENRGVESEDGLL